MIRLLSAGFSRAFRKKTFLIGAAIMAVSGLMEVIDGYLGRNTALDAAFFEYVSFALVLISIFCAMFIGTEYGCGTMRNKIIAGHKRSSIYLSNFIICTAVGFMLCAAYFVTYLGLGIPLLGFFRGDFGGILTRTGCSMVMLIAAAGLYTLISTVMKSKSASAVVCIILSFVMLIGAAVLDGLLSQPESVPSYPAYDSVYIETYPDGEYYADETVEDSVTLNIPAGEPEYVPNPHYVGGIKRKIFQFMIDFLPGGQAIQITLDEVSDPPLLIAFSLIIAALTTAAGLLVFNKINLN